MDEISREREFLMRMQEVVAEAKENGNAISEEELSAKMEDLSLTDEQMAQVRAYLASNHIGIGEPLSMEEQLTEEEHHYLEDYMEMLEELEIPADSVLDALKIRAMAGEIDAQKELSGYMLPKVLEIAKLYVGQDVYLEDLIGTGNEAVVRGVGMLAPLEGPEEVEGMLAKLVMDAMEDVIAAQIDDKARDSKIEERVNLVADKARALAEDLGRKVTVAELVGEGELSEDDVLEAIRLSSNKIEDIDYREEL